MRKIKACSHFSLESIIWEVITGNAYSSRLIGFSIGPESLPDNGLLNHDWEILNKLIDTLC